MACQILITPFVFFSALDFWSLVKIVNLASSPNKNLASTLFSQSIVVCEWLYQDVTVLLHHVHEKQARASVIKKLALYTCKGPSKGWSELKIRRKPKIAFSHPLITKSSADRSQTLLKNRQGACDFRLQRCRGETKIISSTRNVGQKFNGRCFAILSKRCTRLRWVLRQSLRRFSWVAMSSNGGISISIMPQQWVILTKHGTNATSIAIIKSVSCRQRKV